ncbi:unnamed protein product [Strongylus vulgaris]|uniref:LTD domain-containing protein n=1 Tax=Strongylus vulgaris TaxID=40348 RepID=A0A3P7JLM1_STRVU|nr:unnamed protein product [Strongylus vulgaris]
MQKREVFEINNLPADTTADAKKFRIIKQKTYTGDILIKDCDKHGNFVVIENAGRGDHRLSGFRISRFIGGKERSFTFPDHFALGPRETVQVSARGSSPDRGNYYIYHLVYESDTTWGTSATFVTRLFNPQGNEVALLEVRPAS